METFVVMSTENTKLKIIFMGREFEVVSFPDTDEGTDEANRYMSENNYGVITVEDGNIYLAHMDDDGTPIH